MILTAQTLFLVITKIILYSWLPKLCSLTQHLYIPFLRILEHAAYVNIVLKLTKESSLANQDYNLY